MLIQSKLGQKKELDWIIFAHKNAHKAYLKLYIHVREREDIDSEQNQKLRPPTFT